MDKAATGTPVGRVFAKRLRDVRQERRWTQAQLADAMTRIGHRLDRTAIARIEAGERSGRTVPRPVSLEEAIAFAVALDVPPSSLYLPAARDAAVQLAPRVQIDAEGAHAWVRGDGPLDPDNAALYRYYTFPRRPTAVDLKRLSIAGADLKVLRIAPREGEGEMSRADFLGPAFVNPDEEN